MFSQCERLFLDGTSGRRNVGGTWARRPFEAGPQRNSQPPNPPGGRDVPDQLVHDSGSWPLVVPHGRGAASCWSGRHGHETAPSIVEVHSVGRRGTTPGRPVKMRPWRHDDGMRPGIAILSRSGVLHLAVALVGGRQIARLPQSRAPGPSRWSRAAEFALKHGRGAGPASRTTVIRRGKIPEGIGSPERTEVSRVGPRTRR